jgi:phospholipid/cholesterol/gamma-HCH transport system permease protein
MKKIHAVIKVKSIAKEQSIKLSEKAIAKTVAANNFFTDVSDFFIFLSRTVKETFSSDFEFKEFLHQSFQIGYKSLPLISVTGFIMGLVLTIQARPSLVHFGAVSLLPGMVAVSLIREMGPVITALICAGKIGSGMGAELGSMKVTEQIDAMEVSSTNPMKFLVVTRVLAATLMIPVLVLYSDTLGLSGSEQI